MKGITTTEYMINNGHIGGAVSGVYPGGPDYRGKGDGWIGSPDTAGLIEFRFDIPHHPLLLAIWRVCVAFVTPDGRQMTTADGDYIIRLIQCDGSGNKQNSLGYMNSNDIISYYAARSGIGLYNWGLDVTNDLNAYIGQQKFIQVGTDVSGDWKNTLQMYTSRLELVWGIDS